MSRYRLVGAAIALAVMTAPAMAQQVISEPGYCAFFIPTRIARIKDLATPTPIQISHAAPVSMRERGRAVKPSTSRRGAHARTALRKPPSGRAENERQTARS